MPCIVNKSPIEQSVAKRNKKLVSIISLCLLSYSRSEQTNLFQMLNGYFLFANHVPKRAVETLHQMGFVVSSNTICQTLQVNAQAILSRLKERAQSQRLFISYNNMNFYEKVRNERLYNKAHIVNYTIGYVCFMNADNGSFLPYINHNQVQHEAVTSFVASNFLLDQIGLNHQMASTYYILVRALEQHFAPAMRKQKHVVAGKLMPKYFNWPMPLKDIRCAIRKTDVIFLPILPLNKATISETIDILHFLVERLSLQGVVEDKIVPIKRDFLTIKNVTQALYCKQDEPNTLYKFS